MSRAERERWKTGAERWPHLQAFLSEHLAEDLFGDSRLLADKIEIEMTGLENGQKSHIATECWAFMRVFRDRHDDRQFLRDGFGVQGTIMTYDRGRGQTGLSRLKLVYDAVAASLRRNDPDWQPDV
jgi:hypothetical protein